MNINSDENLIEIDLFLRDRQKNNVWNGSTTEFTYRQKWQFKKNNVRVQWRTTTKYKKKKLRIKKHIYIDWVVRFVVVSNYSCSFFFEHLICFTSEGDWQKNIELQLSNADVFFSHQIKAGNCINTKTRYMNNPIQPNNDKIPKKGEMLFGFAQH